MLSNTSGRGTLFCIDKLSRTVGFVQPKVQGVAHVYGILGSNKTEDGKINGIWHSETRT